MSILPHPASLSMKILFFFYLYKSDDPSKHLFSKKCDPATEGHEGFVKDPQVDSTPGNLEFFGATSKL